MDRKRKFPIGIAVLCALVINMIAVVGYRFVNGIGAISNLSDGRPWGVWISFDLYCGIALAAGGFTLAAIIHIFMRDKYQVVFRAALLTAFLGYLLEILALIPDLGQPWYLWHFFIYWNLDSPMFYVALCVMTFTVILLLEFSPVIMEAFKTWNFPIVRNIKWEIPIKLIRTIQMPLIILGIVISVLHQSTLGTMFLLMTGDLHPLWYSTSIPIFFLLTAVAVGPAMVLFEANFSNKVFGHKLDIDIYRGLSKISVIVLSVYLLYKFIELAIAGEFGLLFTSGHYSLLWWIEILVGVLLPIVLFLLPSIRNNKKGLFWCATLVVVGLILNRFNVSMFALDMRPGYSYAPHWMELSISVGLLSFGMLIIWLAYRYLPMHGEKEIPAAKA